MRYRIVRIREDGAIIQTPIGISPQVAYSQAPEEFMELYREMTKIVERSQKQLTLEDYVTFL